MILPALDLETVELPLRMGPTPLEVTEELVEGWLEALAPCPASERLVSRGFAPPQVLTGNTVFLAFRHYDLVGGIYSREQVTYCRPIRIGETLTVEGEIAATYLREGRRYRLMCSVSRDAAGRVVARSRSTGLQQMAPVADVSISETPPRVEAPTADLRRAQENPRRQELRSLLEGETMLSEPHTVTLQMMRAQAGPEDRNPIHTDVEVARRAGLEAPIAGGPHVLGFAQEVVLDRMGEDALSFGSHFDARWLRQVRAGAAVIPRIKVDRVGEDAVALELEIECEGQLAMVAKATIPLGS